MKKFIAGAVVGTATGVVIGSGATVVIALKTTMSSNQGRAATKDFVYDVVNGTVHRLLYGEAPPRRRMLRTSYDRYGQVPRQMVTRRPRQTIDLDRWEPGADVDADSQVKDELQEYRRI